MKGFFLNGMSLVGVLASTYCLIVQNCNRSSYNFELDSVSRERHTHVSVTVWPSYQTILLCNADTYNNLSFV